jgi:pimeloyl-ACP methyl ester carboxylesterase
MQAPNSRTFTISRIVALSVIALMVFGLAYLRFAPDGGSVSVPKGAHAGQLVLKPCHYSTEKGSYDADCGTLVVPENRTDAQSRLIALPVTRIRARAAHPDAAIFRLQGGPGITNMTFKDASRVAPNHDVVLVGYRGIDGSVRLQCPEVVSALKHSADFLGEKSFRAYANGFRSCTTRLEADGVDLAGYGLPQRVDDLETARKALGYGRIDLLSESVGTRTAMIYSWRYPQSIHRSVMIGVNPPGHFLWYPKTTDEQVGRYARLCAHDETCSKQTGDLAASLKRTATHVPGRFWFLPIRKGNARIASFYGLMESTADSAPLSGPMVLNAWLAAARGDTSGLWFESTLAALAFPESFVWGDMAAVSRSDTRAAKRYFSTNHSDAIIGSPGTDFLFGGGRLLHAWPANPAENEYTNVRDSNVETLLVGGTLDFATPPQAGTRELLPHLPNGHQVVLSELGHTTSFWSYEPKASTRLLNAFFDSGKVDKSLYTPARVDFTPDVTQTALGKGLAAAMIGLAFLTVLSLLLMWRRVHKRGHFGRKASGVLRSVYPLVLGLGGWFIGLIIVLLAFPTVPLDDEILAALSIGLPIGLGTYWAWVDRDWTARAKTIGLSGATAGALVGALLGFNAAAGAPRRHHHDRRSGRRCEPRPHLLRHLAESFGSRRRRGTRHDGSARGPALDELTRLTGCSCNGRGARARPFRSRACGARCADGSRSRL